MTGLDLSIVQPSSTPGTIQPRSPGFIEMNMRFADMRGAMIMDKERTGYDWFANRAGGIEAFNDLWSAMTQPNHVSTAGYTPQDLASLRAVMGTEPYNTQAVEAAVKGLVTSHMNGTTPAASYDTDGVARIINQNNSDPIADIINGSDTAQRTPTTRLPTP